MSLPISSPSKKRKHRELNGNEPSSSHKKLKKDGKEKSKGKNKADGQFKVVNASVQVSIPPKFSLDPLSGAKEMLDSLVMRYVPALRGVMLCHSNAKFISDTAVLKNECPFSICTVNFDATVWSPQIGMKLIGRINLCSPDHISLLVHRTFNVSIPREHIPTDNWTFEYGPAENDPEFGPHATSMEEKEALGEEMMDIDGNVIAEADPGDREDERGVWAHKITGDRLGGEERQLEFTVIGLTVTNQMLSLKGSIQPDPFSPDHVPQPAVPANVRHGREQDEEDSEGEARREGRKDLQNLDNPTQDSDDEEDPFSHLAQAKQEAMEQHATEKEHEREQKAREKEEKKRKKREKKERKQREKALAAVHS